MEIKSADHSEVFGCGNKIRVQRRFYQRRPSVGHNHKTKMKVVRKNSKGETRQLLLKEYFLNAYLIAVLKKVGEETARFAKGNPAPEQVPVRVRSGS